VIYLLVRQHGRLLLAQDELRERLDKTEQTLLSLPAQFAEVRQAMQAVQAPAAPPMPAGLPIGSPAPEFALPDLDGKERKLQEFLGEPLLTVFFNPQCGFCQQMAPQLGQLPQEGSARATHQSGRRCGAPAAGGRAPLALRCGA